MFDLIHIVGPWLKWAVLVVSLGVGGEYLRRTINMHPSTHKWPYILYNVAGTVVLFAVAAQAAHDYVDVTNLFACIFGFWGAVVSWRLYRNGSPDYAQRAAPVNFLGITKPGAFDDRPMERVFND